MREATRETWTSVVSTMCAYAYEEARHVVALFQHELMLLLGGCPPWDAWCIFEIGARAQLADWRNLMRDRSAERTAARACKVRTVLTRSRVLDCRHGPTVYIGRQIPCATCYTPKACLMQRRMRSGRSFLTTWARSIAMQIAGTNRRRRASCFTQSPDTCLCGAKGARRKILRVQLLAVRSVATSCGDSTPIHQTMATHTAWSRWLTGAPMLTVTSSRWHMRTKVRVSALH